MLLILTTNCEISWLEIEHYYEASMNSDLIVSNDNIYFTRCYKFSPKGGIDTYEGFVFYSINLNNNEITKDTIKVYLGYETDDLFLSKTDYGIFISAYGYDNNMQIYRYDFSNKLIEQFDNAGEYGNTCLSFSPDEKELCGILNYTGLIYKNNQNENTVYSFSDNEDFDDYEVNWDAREAYYITTLSLNSVNFENDSIEEILSIGDTILGSIITDIRNINIIDSTLLLTINEWDNSLMLKVMIKNDTYLYEFDEKENFYQSRQGLYYKFDYVDRTAATLEIYDENYVLINSFSL